MEWSDLLQWPALVVTIVAAWLVSTESKRRRRYGFYTFVISNVLWVLWGLQAHAYALILLQLFLFICNVHGIIKNSRRSG